MNRAIMLQVMKPMRNVVIGRVANDMREGLHTSRLK